MSCRSRIAFTSSPTVRGQCDPATMPSSQSRIKLNRLSGGWARLWARPWCSGPPLVVVKVLPAHPLRRAQHQRPMQDLQRAIRRPRRFRRPGDLLLSGMLARARPSSFDLRVRHPRPTAAPGAVTKMPMDDRPSNRQAQPGGTEVGDQDVPEDRIMGPGSRAAAPLYRRPRSLLQVFVCPEGDQIDEPGRQAHEVAAAWGARVSPDSAFTIFRQAARP